MKAPLRIKSLSFRLLLTCLLFLSPYKTYPVDMIDSKAQLTAAFIYQITKFTQWPEALFAANNQSFSICIMDQQETPLYEYLSALENKSTQGRPIEVVLLKNKQALFERDGNTCEVLFAANEAWEELSGQEVSQLSQTTLLIGGSKVFLQKGGMLALIVIENKMKIFINSSSIGNTPIKLESRLKALAKSI
jgi:hypothetical protein